MTHSQEVFYGVAAQVIPVLFLVSAIERRMVSRGSPKRLRGLIGELTWTATALFFMVVGEVAAFHALVFNTTSYWLEDLTIFSLAVAGANVLIEAFVANLEALIERTEADRPEWAEAVEKLRVGSLWVFGVAMMGGVLLYAHFGAKII
jgi:hypothetical protein